MWNIKGTLSDSRCSASSRWTRLNALKGIIMLLRKVERFLQTHNMAPTKFGRLAASDPRFVLDLRMGRIPRQATEERTLQWMGQFEAGKAGIETKSAWLWHPTQRTLSRPPWPRLEVKGICHVA